MQGDDEEEHFVDIAPESEDEAGNKDSKADDDKNSEQDSNQDLEAKEPEHDTTTVKEGTPEPYSGNKHSTGSSWIHHKLASQGRC